MNEAGQFPQHHRVEDLWYCTVTILKTVFPDDAHLREMLSIAAHVVQEFSKIDPDSYAFRYPASKQGANAIPGVTHINLRRVAQSVHTFAGMMEAASKAISVHLDRQREIGS